VRVVNVKEYEALLSAPEVWTTAALLGQGTLTPKQAKYVVTRRRRVLSRWWHYQQTLKCDTPDFFDGLIPKIAYTPVN
jgi:hypothetical protein